VLQTLGRHRLGVQVAGSAQHRHEQLRLDRDPTGAAVIDRQTVTREVDEQLLTRPVFLAHGDGPTVVDKDVGDRRVGAAPGKASTSRCFAGP
jgi:hypothetical protein